MAKPDLERPPFEIAIDTDGHKWYRLPDDHSGWVHLGICPTPTTVVQSLVYHICNGLLMRYSLWEVLKFSWQNRNNFRTPEPLPDERAVLEYDVILIDETDGAT